MKLYTRVFEIFENSQYCALDSHFNFHRLHSADQKYKANETEFATICVMVCRAGKQAAQNIPGHGQAGFSCAIQQSKLTE